MEFGEIQLIKQSNIIKFKDKSYQVEKYGRYEYFSFVLNGKAYIGGGSSNYNNVDLFDLYQFIP
jgi:hypothetical protein